MDWAGVIPLGLGLFLFGGGIGEFVWEGEVLAGTGIGHYDQHYA